MSEKTVEELIAEVRELDAKATSGPWTESVVSIDDEWCYAVGPAHQSGEPGGNYANAGKDCAFIARSRTLLVQLADALAWEYDSRIAIGNACDDIKAAMARGTANYVTCAKEREEARTALEQTLKAAAETEMLLVVRADKEMLAKAEALRERDDARQQLAEARAKISLLEHGDERALNRERVDLINERNDAARERDEACALADRYKAALESIQSHAISAPDDMDEGMFLAGQLLSARRIARQALRPVDAQPACEHEWDEDIEEDRSTCRKCGLDGDFA